MAKQPAFILLGGFRVLVRNWIYFTELRDRGLKILVVTGADAREAAARAMATPGHPASLIDEVQFVTGSVRIEGSFTAYVVAVVQDMLTRHQIVGLLAAGELLVEPAGLVADALGLPAPGLRATRVARNKYLQRFYLSDWSPASVALPPAARDAARLKDLSWPAVLKPSGRRSSSGVHRVADVAELTARYGDYSDQEVLLVEHLVRGSEYSVETLVQEGEIVFESATAKVTNERTSSSFVELTHTIPVPRDAAADLLSANRSILRRLDFRGGVAHAEFRRDETGNVVLMEIAARTPGDGLLPLYHLATGEPMEPAIIRVALGEAAVYPAVRRCARQVYLEHEPGVLRDVEVQWDGREAVWVGPGRSWPVVEPGEVDDPPALRAVLVLKDRGSRVQPLRSSDDRAVTFLIDAPSPEELAALEARVRDAIRVVVE